jgi:hypothetical protein
MDTKIEKTDVRGRFDEVHEKFESLCGRLTAITLELSGLAEKVERIDEATEAGLGEVSGVLSAMRDGLRSGEVLADGYELLQFDYIREEARMAADRALHKYRFDTSRVYDRKSYEDGFYEGMRLASGAAFTPVSEQEPPHGVELLVKSPSGAVHISSWRPAYNIFACQDKRESSFDWSWKRI